MSLLRYQFGMKTILYAVTMLAGAVGIAGNVVAQNTTPSAPTPGVVRPGDRPVPSRALRRRQSPREGNRRGGRPGQGAALERERKLRELMTSFGFSDSTVQNEVVRYIGEDVRARQALRRTTRELYEAARDPEVTDEQLAQLLKEYREAVEADRLRRERDEAALNERIKYKSNPRLETMLLMFGILGDRTMIIPMGPGRRSGGGRQPGGRPRFRSGGPERGPGSEPERGETTGTLIARREGEIEIKPDNGGPNENYRLRRQNGDWDPDAMQVIAELKEGDTVQIRWVRREDRHIIEIKRVPTE